MSDVATLIIEIGPNLSAVLGQLTFSLCIIALCWAVRGSFGRGK